MGFDSERIISSDIDDGLFCSICSDVLNEPLMVDICEHTYCKECIHSWLKRDKTCPQDRIAINMKQLVQIPRYMKNQLNKIIVKCSYFQRGCAFEATLEKIKTHEKDCLFNDIHTRISRRVDTDLVDLPQHLQRITKHRHKYYYEVIRFEMSENTKKEAIKLAKEALYLCGRINFSQIAAYIKTHLEPEQNKYWHCIVGTDYDCLLTANHCFITLKIDGIYILAFKTK